MLNARAGFTVVEVIVALVILSVAVLGLAGSATRLTTAAATAEMRAQAVYSADDRIGRIEMDRRYTLLDSLYEAVENGVPGPGFVRSTRVEHIQVTSPDTLDYLMVTVNVTGPGLTSPVKRTLVVAAP
ncbi:MAG: prepilin-type N-terminal cleavage/methylation domain-containing protein [Gemmatimonadota bacterium]